MLQDYFHHYGLIAIFTALAVFIPVSMLLLSWAFTLVKARPSKPSPVKQSLYECGMQTIGPARWEQFNFRYYKYALLFLVFDIETIFIYPWAIKFKQLGLFALIEMVVFVLILLVAWLYAWKKRALEWD
jgi:NADH-quinone oxidoreductase subunit A